ncbi:MAG: phosphodiesterase [Corallococcus sp.]|nr:phosphodiesterase [Corallococcus sp.]
MNKVMVITDLHGSEYWTAKAVEAYKANKADLLVLLGDVYNHGPRNPFPDGYAPQKVAEILSEVSDRLIAVKGNCDSEVDEMISDFDFLSHYILTEFNRRLFFTHGHVYNKYEVPHLKSGDVLLYGHFHVNEITVQDGVYCVNVGSSALPKDGHHAYCLVDADGVALYDLQDGSEIVSQKFA